MKFARSIPASIGAAAILALAPMTAMAFPGGQTKETETTTQATTTQEKPQASNIKKSSDIDDQATVLQQFVTEKDGQKRFNEQAAKDAGASDLILESGRKYNAISESRNRVDEFKVHGNYCGPNHSGPGAPIDTLDRLCQEHDKCYGQKGHHACSCDSDLINGITRNLGKFRGPEEQQAAISIAIAFAAYTPNCNPN